MYNIFIPFNSNFQLVWQQALDPEYFIRSLVHQTHFREVTCVLAKPG